MIFVGFGCDEQLLLPTALTDTVADAVRLETTFLLVDSDLHYDERDQVLVAMSQELTETIMTTHIHFTLLLVFPPVFGMRWMTMVL